MSNPSPVDASILKYARRILKRVDRTGYDPSTSTPEITVYNIFDSVDVVEDATGLLDEWGEYVPRYADGSISFFEENKVRSLHITPRAML